MGSADRIFKERLVKKYLSKFSKNDINDFDKKWNALKMWKKAYIDGDLEKTKETSVQGQFFVHIFENVLGYETTTGTEDDIYNQIQEYNNVLDASEADGVLGIFSKSTGTRDVRVVIELKDAKKSLDKKQHRSNHLTPVEQAFSYANKNGARCRWVIVSNFVETRLYRSSTSYEYEVFDIRDIDNEKEFLRFYFFLSKENLISESKSFIDELYEENEALGASISNEFYSKYKELRNNLYSNIKVNNPSIDEVLLFTKTQKIMDRFTFICFCEDCGLLPANVYRTLVDTAKNSFSITHNKLWEELKGLFTAIDKGNPPMKINQYNGGLFKADDILDSLTISDDVLASFLELSVYDFGSDLNVNILGQIFEQSISDVEQIKAEISGETKKTKGKQQDDGIFYTPYYVTRYIVEQTVGKYLSNKKEELKTSIFDKGPFKATVIRRSTNKENTVAINAWTEVPEEKENATEKESMFRNAVLQLHHHYWSCYEEILKNIKICDPACGSGAFLNQCFDFLHEEMNFVLEMKYAFDGQTSLFDIDKEILQNNLYGVDINPESVEITKLSLWLKTAKKNQTLASLDSNIKCGNSIITDVNVVNNAFSWEDGFPDVFSNGGFDIVVGNPPYGAKLDKVQKDFLAKNYFTTEYNYDTYKSFFELGIKLLKPDGYLGYITPNTFFALEKGANKLRKFLFDNNIICKIVELYNVFPTAIVEPVITVFRKRVPSNEPFSSICIPRHIALSSTFLNEGIEMEYVQDDLKIDPQYIFNFRSSKECQQICQLMRRFPRLDTMFDVMTGAKPYQVGKGIPPQTKEVQESKPYTGTEKIDDSWVPYMRGRSISRYCNKWSSNKEYIKYGEWLAEPRNSNVFAGEKIFIRQTGDSLIATIDSGNVSNNTLHSIYPLADCTPVNLYYLLGVLNSSLLNWYYQIVNYLELGKPMAEVKGIYIKKLPIAIGSEEQQSEVVCIVNKLLSLCQKKHETKHKFINFINKTYEPCKISEKLEDFEELSFKDFIKELKRLKVVISASQQIELLDLFEDTVSNIDMITQEIIGAQSILDDVVGDIYEISDDDKKYIEYDMDL